MYQEHNFFRQLLVLFAYEAIFKWNPFYQFASALRIRQKPVRAHHSTVLYYSAENRFPNVEQSSPVSQEIVMFITLEQRG